MSKKLWGGRFKKELAQNAKDYSYSLHTDQVLLPYDIEVSLAHVAMLGKCKIISQTESRAIQRGLKAVLKAFEGKDLSAYASKYEDVHSFIQMQLEKKVGAVAKKLHTARSRNDLVITATKLYMKDAVQSIYQAIYYFQRALISCAAKYEGVIIPGCTHLQHAQAVLFSHHLLSYAEMLDRDASRFLDAYKRIDELPLGSGSISGTTLKIDRAFVAKELGFSRISQNSMDAVSDRDSIIEILSACSTVFMHLSRLSEDVILWNSSEYGFITLADEYATGSSLMPQKKNPDMFELCRGRAGAAYGNLMSVLTMMKGLPLAYNRDMQEDKKPLFETVGATLSSLDVLAGAVKTMKVNKKACAAAAHDCYLYATDLLDYFVKKGIAFADAHALVGKIVLMSQEEGKDLRFFSLEEYRAFSPKVDKGIFKCFQPEHSVAQKRSVGATGKAQVAKRLAYWKERLGV